MPQENLQLDCHTFAKYWTDREKIGRSLYNSLNACTILMIQVFLLEKLGFLRLISDLKVNKNYTVFFKRDYPMHNTFESLAYIVGMNHTSSGEEKQKPELEQGCRTCMI